MKIIQMPSPNETSMLDTQGLRDSFLLADLFEPGRLTLVATDLDRAVVMVGKPVYDGLVEQMTDLFNANPGLILGIAPEGTRKNVRQWRSGFALIAQAADVPVLPAVINYKTKIVTFATLIVDVANAEQTLLAVQRAASTGSGRG